METDGQVVVVPVGTEGLRAGVVAAIAVLPPPPLVEEEVEEEVGVGLLLLLPSSSPVLVLDVDVSPSRVVLKLDSVVVVVEAASVFVNTVGADFITVPVVQKKVFVLQ